MNNNTIKSKPPAMNLDQTLGSLRGDFHRPKLGAGIVFVAAITVFVWAISSTNETEGVGKHILSPEELLKQSRGSDPMARRERQAAELFKSLNQEDDEEKKKEIKPVNLPPTPPGVVRVFAVQMYSEFGAKKQNRTRMEQSVRNAARLGGKFIVFPECALTGYADPTDDRYWHNKLPDETIYKTQKKTAIWPRGKVEYLSVERREDEEMEEYFELYDVNLVAEPINGESITTFSKLAKELNIYIALPFIEKDGEEYYSTCVLLSPEGKNSLVNRKRVLWPGRDSYWATPGDDKVKYVDTPYGRVALLFSNDMSTFLKDFVINKVDIVLQSCALYGKGFSELFESDKFEKAIHDSGLSLIIANWTYKYTPNWDGYGMSRTYFRGVEGFSKSRVRKNDEEEMVLARILYDPEQYKKANPEKPTKGGEK